MSKADSAKSRFGFVFVTLARTWRRAVDRALIGAGLTDATWAPLIHLSESGDGISQTELAQRVGLDTSTLVRLIDLLVERGYVERQVHPSDRRARHIVLTATGSAEVKRLRGELLAIETQLLSGLSDTEVSTMLRQFERIQANAQAGLQ